jgi:hypothetical protein
MTGLRFHPTPSRGSNIPADPGESEHEGIVQGVLESVDAWAGPGSGWVSAGPPESDAHFRALLRVLTYSYATGVFLSAEIESALVENPLLLYLSGGERHDSGTLRSFRRRNRLAVQRCLARTLESSWETGRQWGPVQRRVRSGYARASLGRWGIGLVRRDFEEEAARRIQQAIRSDTEFLDD